MTYSEPLDVTNNFTYSSFESAQPAVSTETDLRLRCYEATDPSMHGQDRLNEAKALYAWISEDVEVVRRFKPREGRGLS